MTKTMMHQDDPEGKAPGDRLRLRGGLFLNFDYSGRLPSVRVPRLTFDAAIGLNGCLRFAELADADQLMTLLGALVVMVPMVMAAGRCKSMNKVPTITSLAGSIVHVVLGGQLVHGVATGILTLLAMHHDISGRRARQGEPVDADAS